jgi:hypothetical protein
MEQQDPRRDDLLAAVLKALPPVKGPDARGEHVCWCPFHRDGQGKPPHDPNLQVSVRGYICHACGAKGGLRKLAEHLGIGLKSGSGGWELVDSWRYYTPDGTKALFIKDRWRLPGGGKTYTLRREAPDDWQACPHRESCQAAQAAAGKRPACRGGWIHNLQEQPCSPAPPKVLYNEPLLAAFPGEPVHLPGGEKCADALLGLGFVSVTNYDGEGAAWRAEDTEKIRAREAVLWLDADDTGRRRGPRVAEAIWGQVATIKLVDLYPDRSDGADVFDRIAERRAQGVEDEAIQAELAALVAAAPEWRLRQGTDGATGESEGEDEPGEAERAPGRPSLSKVAVDLALGAGVELFHDERGEGCAAVPSSTGRCILSLSSRDFGLWLPFLPPDPVAG